MNCHEPMIVVVDSDADRGTALSSQLDQRGYHVFRRSSGIDALQCVVECRPELVLSEFELLDLERPELLDSIHGISPETRVVFLAREGKRTRLLDTEMEKVRIVENPQDPRESQDAIILEIGRILEK